MERTLGSINGNGDGSNGSEGSFQGIFITLGNINESNVSGSTVAFVITACVVLAFIRIRFFGICKKIVKSFRLKRKNIVNIFPSVI